MKPKAKSGRRSYRHGKNKVYLQPVDDMLAVRYAKSREEVRDALSPLGKVREVEPQHLFIVQLPEGSNKEKAIKHVQPLIENGLVDSIVPVLRDEESQLLQVLTDEVTVKFKRAMPKKQREQVEKKFGFTIARQNEFVPNQFVVKVPTAEGVDALKVANELDAADEVEFAAPNFVSERRR